MKKYSAGAFGLKIENMAKRLYYSDNNSMTTLLIVFFVLKLAGLVDWSWWWVMSPMWIGVVFAVAIPVLFLACCGLVEMVYYFFGGRK